MALSERAGWDLDQQTAPHIEPVKTLGFGAIALSQGLVISPSH
jgi:hypothetical protein